MSGGMETATTFCGDCHTIDGCVCASMPPKPPRRPKPPEVAPALYHALIAAKKEMWDMARRDWTMGDFNNWAVMQQINAALTLSDGKAR